MARLAVLCVIVVFVSSNKHFLWIGYLSGPAKFVAFCSFFVYLLGGGFESPSTKVGVSLWFAKKFFYLGIEGAFKVLLFLSTVFFVIAFIGLALIIGQGFRLLFAFKGL